MTCSSRAVLRCQAWPLLVVVLSGCGSHESRIERSLRQAARADPRPVEGRLSVATGFAPWNPSSVSPRLDPAVLSGGKEKRVLRGSRPVPGWYGPEELHRIGLLELYHGAAARAVSALEAAANGTPSPAVLSDLAAAYLALAEDGRPWLRVDAVAAATRAAALAPGEPCAAFNLALALERTSLAYESGLAWERYLALEDGEAWRREAAERLARLGAPTTRDRWEAQKDHAAAAAAAGDQATLERLVRQFPTQVKEFLESDLLSAWAGAAGTPAAAARLAVAKQVAMTLAGTGERIYLDAVGVIESRADASHALAGGQRAYVRGLALRGDCSRAMPEFERAEKLLSAGGSPLALAARLQRLTCIYRGHASQAGQPLAELASELQGRHYPTLLAGTAAMRGLCAMAGGRHSEAVAHYEGAARLLAGIGDAGVAKLYGMLDEAYRFLGDRDAAWRYRLRALGTAVAAGDRQTRHAVLAGLARDLVDSNRREAARAVLAEMLANAWAWREPGAAAEALLRRIQLELLNGSGDQAAADIAACGRLLKRFRQPADRERLEAELTVATAERQLAGNPAAALEAILAAMPRLEASGNGLLLPRALLDLARAWALLGETAAAEQAFDRALRIYEARREGTTGEALRIRFFSTAQASFDAMIRFQAIERGDARAAFAYSERVRARALRDRVISGSRGAEPLPLDEQLARIPADVAVLSYTVLPEALLVWRLRRGSLQMRVLPAARSEVAEVAAALQDALAGADWRETGKTAAARAFDVLLGPALAGLPAGTELVFVPDRELYRVPFSALFDRSRGRYLIEDHACSVVPSLELYVASRERRTPARRRPRRVLAVGDPSFDAARFPALPRLPHARQEALAVAALYEEALPLVSEEATRQRILDALPGRDVLHLAAHVVIDSRDPLGSLVATADRGHAPLQAGDLDAGRLAGVDLVYLAACDTAPGFADGDREGVAGLARAFLGAGVPAVVATLWAVDDQAAARLAVAFHARLRQGEPPARALRLAQLALLSDPSSPAPFAWAPFQVFQGP